MKEERWLARVLIGSGGLLRLCAGHPRTCRWLSQISAPRPLYPVSRTCVPLHQRCAYSPSTCFGFPSHVAEAKEGQQIVTWNLRVAQGESSVHGQAQPFQVMSPGMGLAYKLHRRFKAVKPLFRTFSDHCRPTSPVHVPLRNMRDPEIRLSGLFDFGAAQRRTAGYP